MTPHEPYTDDPPASFATEHVIPLGDMIARSITEAYLRPMLETLEGFSPEEALVYEIEFDAAPILSRSDPAAPTPPPPETT